MFALANLHCTESTPESDGNELIITHIVGQIVAIMATVSDS